MILVATFAHYCVRTIRSYSLVVNMGIGKLSTTVFSGSWTLEDS